jgi:hypothetical protein
VLFGGVRRSKDKKFKLHFLTGFLIRRRSPLPGCPLAEALGQAGDPRLDENNWVNFENGTFLMGAQSKDPSKPNYDSFPFVTAPAFTHSSTVCLTQSGSALQDPR